MKLRAAFERPFEDLVKLLIGLLFSLLPILNFFAMGYALKNARVVKRKNTAPLPKWENWGELFIDGLFACVIKLIYLVPTAIMCCILFGLYALSLVGLASPVADTLFIAFAILWTVLTCIVFLITIYIVPAGIYQFGLKRKFKDAFQFSGIFNKAFSGKYAKIFFCVVLYAMGLGLIVGESFFGYALISFLVPMTFLSAMTDF